MNNMNGGSTEFLCNLLNVTQLGSGRVRTVMALGARQKDEKSTNVNSGELSRQHWRGHRRSSHFLTSVSNKYNDKTTAFNFVFVYVGGAFVGVFCKEQPEVINKRHLPMPVSRKQMSHRNLCCQQCPGEGLLGGRGSGLSRALQEGESHTECCLPIHTASGRSCARLSTGEGG